MSGATSGRSAPTDCRPASRRGRARAASPVGVLPTSRPIDGAGAVTGGRSVGREGSIGGEGSIGRIARSPAPNAGLLGLPGRISRPTPRSAEVGVVDGGAGAWLRAGLRTSATGSTSRDPAVERGGAASCDDARRDGSVATRRAASSRGSAGGTLDSGASTGVARPVAARGVGNRSRGTCGRGPPEPVGAVVARTAAADDVGGRSVTLFATNPPRSGGKVAAPSTSPAARPASRTRANQCAGAPVRSAARRPPTPSQVGEPVEPSADETAGTDETRRRMTTRRTVPRRHRAGQGVRAASDPRPVRRGRGGPRRRGDGGRARYATGARASSSSSRS